MHLLTVLKFGKSPTAELLSTGKDINGLMSSEGCIIRVGVRTRAGRVVVWHVLPAKDKEKKFSLLLTSISFPNLWCKNKTAELQPASKKVTLEVSKSTGENTVTKGLLAHCLRQRRKVLPHGKGQGGSVSAEIQSTLICWQVGQNEGSSCCLTVVSD